MLRSFFSLIQRIIDNSDKRYNNTKSKAVIYCCTKSDQSVIMSVETEGKRRDLKCLDSNRDSSVERENSFSIETEHGDVITCKHPNEAKIVPASKKDNQNSDRVSFTNTEEFSSEVKSGDAEVQPNVKDLIAKFPKKRIEIATKGVDQISLLLEQIKRMKTGLERLHEIALQFNCSERFSEDINFLINNVRPHLERHARRRNIQKSTSKGDE